MIIRNFAVELGRQAIAVTLAALLAVPLWGASNIPILGTVADSQFATVRGIALANGTNIYDGDIIATGDKGNAWISMPGGAGILLGAQTQVQISRHEQRGPVDFDLSEGTVKFHSTDATFVEGLLYDATIRPADSPNASGYIEMTSPHSAIIGSDKGNILITTEHNGASRIIPAGSAIAVSLVPFQESNRTARKRWGLIVVLGTAVIGGLVVLALVWGHHQKFESPSDFPQ
jgi:hypothetical protein